MNSCYNLDGIHSIYQSAFKNKDEIIACEVSNGRGRFVIMCFYDHENNNYNKSDFVYIYMKNIQHILGKKMYGSHVNGKYNIFLSSYEKELFKKELQINDVVNGPVFNFDEFFSDLNSSIPTQIQVSQKASILKDNWRGIRDTVKKEIPDYEKTILIGPRKLKLKKPRYKTLYKLHLFVDGNESIKDTIIEELLKRGVTLAWTTPDNKVESANLFNVLNEIKNYPELI